LPSGVLVTIPAQLFTAMVKRRSRQNTAIRFFSFS